MNARDAAREFGRLFPAVYLQFHRRRLRHDPRLTPQMWAVLQHLAMAGPLAVAEPAEHMDRAQSVMSEIVDSRVTKGLLERMRDARDKRRHLVWLTDHAHETLTREREVLADDRLEQAMSALPASDRGHLLKGLHALLRAPESNVPKKERPS